jgi:hypothetical protein
VRSSPAHLIALCAALAVLSVATYAVCAATGTDGEMMDAARRATASDAGIWKAVVPPAAMHGEFDNDDPIGLTAGVSIRADCSINWVDPDEDRLYCFSSATSLVVFLEAPRAYLERARAQWRRLRESG